MDAHIIQLNDLIIDTNELVHLTLGELVMLSTSLAPGLEPIEVNPGRLHAAILDTAARA